MYAKYSCVILLTFVVGVFLEDKPPPQFFPNGFPGNMNKFREVCAAETKVNPDFIFQAFAKGNFAEDASLKCYFKCIYEKLGCMDKDGNIDLIPVIGEFPSEDYVTRFKNAINKCQGDKASDLCQRAFNVIKCIRLENPLTKA